MTKFEVIKGGNKPEWHKDKKERLDKWVSRYSTTKDQKPRWCVFGNSPEGETGVIHWIKRSNEEEFAAHKIAQIVNDLGGTATAEKTEWNKALEGEPIYHESSSTEELRKQED